MISDPFEPDSDGDGLLDFDEFGSSSTFSIPASVHRKFTER